MSIRVRLNMVLLATMMVAIALTCIWSYVVVQRRALTEVQDLAALQMATGQAIRRYTVEHVRDVVLQDSHHFSPAAIPSFAANTSMAYVRDSYPSFSYREVALNPTNPQSRAQEWEVEAIRTFRDTREISELYSLVGEGQNERVLFAKPLRATAECLLCHNTPANAPPAMLAKYGSENGFGWKVGEVIGAQVVTVSFAEARAKVIENLLRTISLSVAVFALFFIGLNLTLRHVVIMPIQESHESWRRLASVDALTELPNRREFMARLEDALVRAKADGSPVSVVTLDIDHFKKVNDTHGHQVGDEVLYEFARRLSDTSKRRDLPARVGGEEFAVLLPGSALDEAEPFAQALRQTIAERPFNRVGELTSSLGLAQWKPGETAAALLDRADQALYRAKSQGRNQVCLAA